jgi:hypothetical protein
MPFINSIRQGFDRSTKIDQNNSKFKVTGGDKVFTAGGYTIHMFTRTGDHNFVIEPADNSPAGVTNLLSSTLNGVEIMMVGGGGASGQYSGGGGGGEVIYISRNLAIGAFPLNVGVGAPAGAGNYSTDKNGRTTTGFSETVKGGGGGKGSDDTTPPNNGTLTDVANGGGGCSRSAGYTGTQGTTVGTGVTRYGGFRGGQEGLDNNGPYYPGAGGGGAGGSRTGQTGGGGSNNTEMRGAPGVSFSLTGTSYFYGGGGGGQTYYGGVGGNGGQGGGGAGSGGDGGGSGGPGLNNGQGAGTATSGGSGGANTGGGGGGGNGQNGSAGGGGGSGFVVVRYPTGS